MLESERRERARRAAATGGASTGLRGRALTVFNEMRRAGVAEEVALLEVRRQGHDGLPAEQLTEAETAARDALPAPARAIYESWRSVGHSHSQALAEVRVATAEPIDEAELDRVSARAFGRQVGKSQADAALDDATGRVFGRKPRKDMSESAQAYESRSAAVFGRRVGGA